MSNLVETTHFEGRVSHWALPLLTPPTAPDAPMQKRLMLPQGELAQLENGGTLRYLAVLELRAGAVRGNHYHHHKRELVYVIEGQVRLALLALDTGKRLELALRAGDLVRILPGIAHALITETDGWALEAAPDPVDPGDTVKHPVVAV